jgi:hypothetical protein
MTDIRTTSSGSPVSSAVLVSADQVSIIGDGSHANPLHAVPGGVSVTTDGVTILGNGTTGSPLHAGSVSVTTDGTTIAGNGTAGSPLRTTELIRIIAGALVNSDGSFPGINNHPGFLSVAHTGTGVYTLVLTSYPAISNNLMVEVTQAGMVAGSSAWIGTTPPNIVIRTFDSTGTLADRVFTITCFDTTPPT